VSPTGRNLKGPRIQNIPLRTELAKKVQDAFRKEMPRQFVEVGYSELELRVLAELFSGPHTGPR
jgi:DNA polymerase I-like protein with 3'-5' exonuclease and polymerase domains